MRIAKAENDVEVIFASMWKNKPDLFAASWLQIAIGGIMVLSPQ